VDAVSSRIVLAQVCCYCCSLFAYVIYVSALITLASPIIRITAPIIYNSLHSLLLPLRLVLQSEIGSPIADPFVYFPRSEFYTRPFEQTTIIQYPSLFANGFRETEAFGPNFGPPQDKINPVDGPDSTRVTRIDVTNYVDSGRCYDAYRGYAGIVPSGQDTPTTIGVAAKHIDTTAKESADAKHERYDGFRAKC
jgi:hypothetical protein